MDLKIKSTELLNTIKYNYGKLGNSKCADLSESNRLAICTDRCIYLINLNLNWPQPPTKYSANYKKLSKNKLETNNNNTAKQSFNIDAWLQDLNESKNELIYLNLIRNVAQSSRIESVYKELISIEDTLKRKSFHRLIREQVVKDKDVIESNLDQYLKNKHFIDQIKLFDPDMFDYLSFLNPITNPNQEAKNNPANKTLFSYFYYGFKYCKWNQNSNLHLLTVITACNQLLLFDCTLLNFDIRVNTMPVKNEDSYVNIFDTTTGSKCFNLSELWLIKQKSELITNKPNSIDQYFDNIKQILPLHVCWSKPIQLNQNNLVNYFILLKFLSKTNFF
jgi:hypothetical protein